MDDEVRRMVEAQAWRIKRHGWKLSARSRAIMALALQQLHDQLPAASGAWDYASKLTTMRQIRMSLTALVESQVRETQKGLVDVSRQAVTDTATYLRKLDSKYHGTARPLRIDALEWVDQNADQLSRVRLQQYRRSFQRYGASAVHAVENEIARTILVGETWVDAREKVWAAVRHQVGDRQWMVDRILRTETSAAYNGMTLAALVEEDNDPTDRMYKRLAATFDSRTGTDSMVLHGQTVPVNEPFHDAMRGITYMAPPNRPNDREVVIGWRQSYGLDLADEEWQAADREEEAERRQLVHGALDQLQSRERSLEQLVESGVDVSRHLEGVRHEIRVLRASLDR